MAGQVGWRSAPHLSAPCHPYSRPLIKPPRSLSANPSQPPPPLKPLLQSQTPLPPPLTPPPPQPPGICPACIHYSPCWLHRQHSHDCWLLLPLPASTLNTINLVIAFVLGVCEWLSKPPMILQAYTLAALLLCWWTLVQARPPGGTEIGLGALQSKARFLAQPHIPY